MLVPQSLIAQAQNLSITDICHALARSGRAVARNEITGVKFLGMTTTGSFVYEIAGPDPRGEDHITLGRVYVKFRRLPMSSEFQLVADY